MSNNQFNEFNKLHNHQHPLVLMNVWDAASATMVQNLGAKAVATSSASLAWANGYADGGSIPSAVHLAAIERILRVINIPLTVDIEEGYSDSPDEVADWVAVLVSMGVSGVNIEDGDQSPDLLGEKIDAIRSLVGIDRVFINARTDVYLRELVAPDQCVDTCLKRAARYIEAGAHGVFVPGLAQAEEVTQIVNGINVPLNVMVTDGVANLCQWYDLKVARISMGPAPFLAAYSKLFSLAGSMVNQTVPNSLSFDQVNNLF